MFLQLLVTLITYFYLRWHKVNLADKEVPFDFIGQILTHGTQYLSLCWANLHTRLFWDVFPRKNQPIFEGDSDGEDEVCLHNTVGTKVIRMKMELRIFFS